jgi:serine/threonine protein kinase
MATLYLGRRRDGSGSYRAIKVVRPHLAKDAGYVAMFHEEARLGMMMTHPNLIRTEMVGQDAGVHFLAMEFVSGASLAELLGFLVPQRRVMRPELAVYIAIGVARALHVAHELRDESGRALSVVHRDVSPQNVLLSHEGEVKLIDFGVAKAAHRQWATMEGSLKGKLGYMSPEQARAGAIDRRTDVYALGVVLWENLTHRRLFAGETTELLKRVQNPNVPPPSRFAAGLSPALDAAVMRALAPNPDQRFASARDLEVALIGCPEASSVDVDALSALVLSVMHERPDDGPDKSVRDTLEMRRPSIDRRTGALAAVTMEIAMPLGMGGGRSSLPSGSLPPGSLPPSAFSPSAYSPAPPTRVSLGPPSPPGTNWPFRVVVGLLAVFAVVASGAGVWWALSAMHPAAAPAVASPSPPSVPSVELVPMAPSAPAPDMPAVVLEEIAPAPEPEVRRSHRGHRGPRPGDEDDTNGDPYGLPPPYGPDPSSASRSTSGSSAGHGLGGSLIPPSGHPSPAGPPLNGPARRAPVRTESQDVPPPAWP